MTKTTFLSNRKNLIYLIASFALLKLLVHFMTYDHYELHRDAYLYYAQSEHLDWGFIAVPPLVGAIGKLATTIFGHTTFALRFFPALIGALNVFLVGLMVVELRGKWKAVSLACLAYLLSPAYLHTNSLFQPVSFNHFFWLWSAYFVLRLIHRNDPKYWFWLAMTFGLGFLNKYSIVFFFAGFLLALAFSKHRQLYLNKYFLWACLLAIAIILPNLIWQYQHTWPVMMHMKALRETQLVNVRISDFLIAQLIMNAQALLLWLMALILLLFHPKERTFQVFGLTFLIVVFLQIAGSGKAYYTLGAYPMLFAFGAYHVEKYTGKWAIPTTVFLLVLMFAGLYLSIPYDGIPLVRAENIAGKSSHRWEDGNYHKIPQDMADMTGWKELGEAVASVYKDLGPENKDNVDIFCNNYGQAGAVMFYGKSVNVPQPISTNGSFVFWSPDSLSKEYFILVDHDPGDEDGSNEMLPVFFKKVELVKTIDNPYFRENGTNIYLCQHPTVVVKEHYKKLMGVEKGKYKR
ncbi:glycosyltransferase family 39 protein [Echinicola sp. CAU 1574]|uniref:Glycosyltransferase family 39 protein n=1 Tax=Echinicola arenosa TaxID=2774144 RepID=A0ABR9AJC5_9BACT|nr:glycosyltransferase family 39 protein [Echinicola arenosa]MBD8488872.1 glycosyltransferase family 39 protein [Echinicola arenosa]